MLGSWSNRLPDTCPVRGVHFKVGQAGLSKSQRNETARCCLDLLLPREHRLHFERLAYETYREKRRVSNKEHCS
jgi:hypothetical protein